MLTRWKIIAAALSTTLLLSISTGNALAENHSHSHGAGEPVQLTLNNGQKWASDDKLRQGMARIRDALAAALPAIHDGKITTQQYHELARKINEQIEFMVKNCKLDKKTDEMLHLVLADIIAGAEAINGQDGSAAHKGVEKIIHALNSYGEFFVHPGWHGVLP